MVRHGKSARPWDQDPDSGLSDLGRYQADSWACAFGHHRVAMPIHVSPRARARETAASLAAIWKCTPTIIPELDEIPIPPDVPLAQRLTWLQPGFPMCTVHLTPALCDCGIHISMLGWLEGG
ncbi:MAG: histidine phosphatase family protein [Alphaproteobacteria bacterium]|nr:histidine phosphatase family protein [Alphaproteobacteria bacterium]